ncbi:MAG: aspartic peptidase domain-containing protein, partial [Benjaminiella poitrasii]
KKKVYSKSLQSLRRRSTSNGPIYNDKGSIYMIDVQIGTPPQLFELILDTGSADLWVPGVDCPSSVCPLARFNGTASSTFKRLDEVFDIAYGIGSASGVYALDTISIAGMSVEQQQIAYVNDSKNILTDQQTLKGESYTPTVSSADNATTFSSDNSHDGIFGLGYPYISASAKQYNPFFFNLKAQNKLTQNVFSIFMNTTESYGDSGELIFGGIDSSKYKDELKYLPLIKTISRNLTELGNSYGFWQVNGEGVRVKNGSQITSNVHFPLGSQIIFDTGTTLSTLPTSTISEVLSAAFGSENLAYDSNNNYFQVKCSAAKQNNSVQYVLSSSDNTEDNPIIVSIPIAELLLPLDTDNVKTATVCVVGIIPFDGPIFFGQTVLRSLYQVYDVDNNRIGIASAVG